MFSINYKPYLNPKCNFVFTSKWSIMRNSFIYFPFLRGCILTFFSLFAYKHKAFELEIQFVNRAFDLKGNHSPPKNYL